MQYIEPTIHWRMYCTVCGAAYGKPLTSDFCPSGESRARHRQILDMRKLIANPFDNHSVLTCHAKPAEMQAFLSKAAIVGNSDVRPLGYADR